jgi:hypothetical protein
MAATSRQTNLLIQQDWKKIYQSFSNADFQSYDFETLRKSMVDYLRTYYPEDFNDFVESSEYIALIDLIAYLGQNLAFRTDLNARENFIDTAERRDSVLKLARLVSYVPKRNVCASGLLRIDSISTTEDIRDSNGLSLANLPINWNDPGNDNWLEQFSLVLNAALVDSQTVGKPGNSQSIGGITTDEYSLNILTNVLPTLGFESIVNGSSMRFELVSPTSLNQEYLYEREPRPRSIFNVLYRNDNLGNDSTNTGYFFHFKQGQLSSLDFTLDQKLANRVVSVNVDNINNDDIWLYQVDDAGNYLDQWEKVENVNGVNVVYNTSSNRRLFQINTRLNDQIDLVFGDGAFADIPSGNFRLFYRVSNGLNYKIAPAEIQSVLAPIVYVSRSNRSETLNIRASLNYTVTNATPKETLAEIKTKAPQQYYTQNRMITGEDYNILPFTKFNSILKIKSTNRSSSGISRYLDSLDITGKYSSTNIFAEDGILYRNETIDSVDFAPSGSGDVVGQLNDVINNQLLVDSYEAFSQFIYAKLRRFTTQDVDVNGSLFDSAWQQMTVSTNQSTGFFTLNSTYVATINPATGKQTINTLALPALKIGTASSNSFKFIKTGSIVRFRASGNLNSQPRYFNSANEIVDGVPNQSGDKLYLYATVVNVLGDGTGEGVLTLADTGPVTLSSFVPTGAYVDEIIPKIYNIIPQTILRSAITLINSKKNFGLRFDQITEKWAIIQPQDLKLKQLGSVLINTDGYNAEYSESAAGNTSSASADSSWIMAFVSGNFGYKIYYRQINYIFESPQETKFYFDPRVRVYDSKSATTLSDQIKVLRSNSVPDGNSALYEDKTWFIYKMIVDPDGRENTGKILIKFSDSNRDGVPDNPDLFEELVNPDLNEGNNKYVYFKKTYNNNNFVQYTPIDSSLVSVAFASQGDIVQAYNLYEDGQIFYATNENIFYELSVTAVRGVETRTLTASANGETYLWLFGRSGLYFQYRHTAPANRRIDPSPNNIVDLYILTKSYAADYQSWIRDTSGKVQQPEQTDVEQLRLAYGELENFKTISDTIIYNPARFKPIIGAKANESLRATIKVVKNSEVVISDNDVKVAVITAVNKFFDVNNWDFGESFYFSELSAYLHTELATKINSVIIVPKNTQQNFGNLYQINAEPDEILISAATPDDVEIITAITAIQL